MSAWAAADPLSLGSGAAVALTAATATIATFVGALEIARFAARRDPAFLLVGLALAGAGLAQASGLVAELAYGAAGDGGLPVSLAARPGGAALPLLVLTGGWLLPRSSEHRGRMLAVTTSAAMVTAALVTLPWWPNAAAPARPPAAVHQPLALWVALAYGLAALVTLKRGDLSDRPLGRWMSAALYLGLLDQLLLQPFVAASDGTYATLSSAVTLAMYVVATGGVLANMAAHMRAGDAALRRWQEEVGARNRAERALALEAARLKRSNESLAEFAYVASHDLQEPLRMVSSYLQLVERRYAGTLDEDGREFIAFAVDGAVRMKKLINDLLAFSRVGTKGRDPTEVDAGEVLAGVLRDLGPALDESSGTVTHDPMPLVVADPAQLQQLLLNLVGNALKFRRPGVAPEVHVGVTHSPDGWEFSVTDNGIGIEEAYAERVFGIFQRLHSSAEYTGSGIGLAVARKIVERHGGRIWVDGASLGGTRIRFTLPYATAGREVDRAEQEEPDTALQEHVRTLIERAAEVVG